MALINLPNLMTVGRIFIVPCIVWAVWSEFFSLAAFLFIAAGLSDIADGYLARRWHQCTSFGGWVDPVADKIMLDSLYILLGLGGYIPVWLVIFVVGRDILIVSFIALTMLCRIEIKASPTRSGKTCTLMQIIHIGAVLVFLGVFGKVFPSFIDMVFEWYNYCLLGIILYSSVVYFRLWVFLVFMRERVSGDGVREGDSE